MALNKTKRESNRLSKLARIVAGFNLATVVAGIAIIILAGNEPYGLFTITFITTAIAYSVIAVLILTRHPGHPVGWTILVIGFAPSVTTLLMAIGDVAPQGSRLGDEILPWLGNLAFFPTYLLPVTLVMQYFPNGRLPS